MTARLMRAQEVAERLETSVYRVHRARDLGLLPCRRDGRLIRYTQDDIDTYLARIKVDRAKGADSGQTVGSQRHRRAS